MGLTIKNFKLALTFQLGRFELRDDDFWNPESISRPYSQ